MAEIGTRLDTVGVVGSEVGDVQSASAVGASDVANLARLDAGGRSQKYEDRAGDVAPCPFANVFVDVSLSMNAPWLINVRDVFDSVKYDGSFSVNIKRVNLRQLAQNAYNTIQTKRKPYVTLRLRSPPSFCNVWNSGRMFCMGVSDLGTLKKACRRYGRIVQKHGIFRDGKRERRPVRICNFRVNQVHASHTLPLRVNIRRFAEDNREIVFYEPELEPNSCTVTFRDIATTIQVYIRGHIKYKSTCIENIYYAAIQIIPMIKYCCRLKKEYYEWSSVFPSTVRKNV